MGKEIKDTSTKYSTIMISKELQVRLKIRAAETGTNQKELLDKIVTEYLNSSKTNGNKK